MPSKKGKGSGSFGRTRRGAAGRARNGSVDHKPVSKKSGAALDGRNPRAAADHETNARVWTGGSRFLAALPPDELAVVRPSLSTISLESGHILYEQHARIDRVYFPETAVVSLLSRMANDAVVEVGTIGNEGVVGLGLFLGADVSLPETLAQVPGTAQFMTSDDFRAAVTQLPVLRSILAKCMHAFVTQVSQTAACNRLHGIEQRCARWLLLTHDRVGGADTFPLTHQFLSFMLGVRRAGVTEALGALTLAGLIRSVKGSITILDRPGLEAACCECYAIVRLHSGAPFAPAAVALAGD
jgi:CRP-like cAMP-binding protein